MIENRKQTDSIPRASVQQIINGLAFIVAKGGKAAFEEVRVYLQSVSTRRGPSTQTAMWTVARDVLTDLQKLGFVDVGILPRKRSDVEKFRETPCKVLPRGFELARLHAEKRGRAYDELLLVWMNLHPYFRAYTSRVLESALYVPDITSIKHLGEAGARGRTAAALAGSMAESVEARLRPVAYSTGKLDALKAGIRNRVVGLEADISAVRADSKRLIDLLQDSVLVPALLEAEELPFDPVTFQHLTKCSEEFYSAAWTSSHPSFEGRMLFSTCDFEPDPVREREPAVTGVTHHGSAHAAPRFVEALLSAYNKVVGGSAGYASAYALRAVVCVELRIQPEVFAACLDNLVAASSSGNITIYTELPFEPPPDGEAYVEVGRRRIGRLKLVVKEGA